jgi:hypothetical protein
MRIFIHSYSWRSAHWFTVAVMALALGIVVVRRRNSGIRPKQPQQQVRPVHGIDNDDDDDNVVILSSTTLWPLTERVHKSYNE